MNTLLPPPPDEDALDNEERDMALEDAFDAQFFDIPADEPRVPWEDVKARLGL